MRLELIVVAGTAGEEAEGGVAGIQLPQRLHRLLPRPQLHHFRAAPLPRCRRCFLVGGGLVVVGWWVGGGGLVVVGWWWWVGGGGLVVVGWWWWVGGGGLVVVGW